MSSPSDLPSGAPGPNSSSRFSGIAPALKKAAKVAVLVIGCLLVVLAVTGLLSKDRIEIPPNHLGQYININGEQIRYCQTGTGPDVLLIHGRPGLIEDWEPLIAAASRKYRVTAYDRPGHGFSSAKSGKYTLSDNADIALDLIDQLHLKEVIVVGHSHGGAVVLAMAVRNPPQVKAFVSLAGITSPQKGGVNIFDVVRLPVIGRGFAVIASRCVGENMVKDRLKRSFSPNDALLTKELVDSRIPVYLQTKVIMAIACEKGAINKDFEAIEPLFSKISKPLNFIHGDSEAGIMLTKTIEFHKRYPATRLTVLKDTGHAVPIVHPEVVVSVIDSLSR